MFLTRGRSGNIFVEYSLVIGIVSLALVTTNIYVKRGIQGKLKGMSDKLISDQHIAEMAKETHSKVDTKIPSSVRITKSLGQGEWEVDFAERDKTVAAESQVIDTDIYYSPGFIPTSAGNIPLARNVDHFSPDLTDGEKATAAEELKIVKERLLSAADDLEQKAEKAGDPEYGKQLRKKALLLKEQAGKTQQQIDKLT